MLRQLQAPVFKRLITSLLVAACIVLVARLLVRYYWEIPQYLAMERASDLREAARVENALATRVGELISLFLPTSVWDDMYHYALEPNDTFINTYFADQDWQASFTDGLFIINREGQLLWHYLSPALLASASRLELSRDQLIAIASQQTRLSNALDPQNFPTGLIPGEGIPLAFASLPIYPNQYRHDAAGFLVAWDLLEADTLEYLQELLQADFIIKTLPQTQHDLPGIAEDIQRNADNEMIWSIEDYAGQPALLARLKLGERRFNDNLVTAATLTEISVAIIVFLFLALVITRYIISPIQVLRRSMQTIHDTQDYSVRINSQRGDEFGELSREYDALLEHIQRQESALRASNNELLQLSNMDALTGIANRRAFDSFLIDSAKELPVSLLLIDIDFFKQFNDHYGHQAGDETLKAVATALHRNSLSSTDLVARYGGEEFAVVLTKTHQQQAQQVAERMKDAVRSLAIDHALSNHKYVSVSIGIATAADTFDPQQLILRADNSLYAAKDQGRNKIVVDNTSSESDDVIE